MTYSMIKCYEMPIHNKDEMTLTVAFKDDDSNISGDRDRAIVKYVTLTVTRMVIKLKGHVIYGDTGDDHCYKDSDEYEIL